VTREKKKWSDLTPTQQKALIAGAAVEVVLTGIALRDLAKRPASEVRGRKWQWVLAFTVQPFGPLAYLLRGRRSAG
jgi:hypothetical protein